MNIKEKAKEFAIKAHKGQVRKNEKDKPMIMHPISVAELLEEYGYDDNVVAAGYLHDVVEDTKYTIEYDNTLDNKITIETKYYESYYDYYMKKNVNDIYVSLSLDYRDRLSVYLENLKENKIYDKNELSRYTVKITMNERDKDRVIIEN